MAVVTRAIKNEAKLILDCIYMKFDAFEHVNMIKERKYDDSTEIHRGGGY